MEIYEAFETDSSAIEEGRWLDIVFQGATVCEIRIRSASPELNPRLRAAMTEQAIGLAKGSNGTVDEMTVRQALRDESLERKLFAAAVVSDWRGVKSKDGKNLKCTPKNIEKVFRDLPLLFNQVKAQAYRWETFRSVIVEESLGNSATS